MYMGDPVTQATGVAPKLASNWIVGDVQAYCKENKVRVRYGVRGGKVPKSVQGWWVGPSIWALIS